jgi:hypothetical protein
MNVGTIAILGGGNGVHATAADLELFGFKVNIFELPLGDYPLRRELAKYKARRRFRNHIGAGHHKRA